MPTSTFSIAAGTDDGYVEGNNPVSGGYLNDYTEDLEMAQRFIEKANDYKALQRAGEQLV